ncbi:hypothetical protein [Streptomyces sp. H27-H5]|uniref:hypothetical protein n=1 Tax=Streptomyces sp. H27-H5 TaxID=2996460 RepID=UPI00226E3320|nr:hypothetical protein [Streptomyces sp. H27-H5]MCY0963126.1 hypothetical protein [Streptomyces sp. H27-H5]
MAREVTPQSESSRPAQERLPGGHISPLGGIQYVKARRGGQVDQLSQLCGVSATRDFVAHRSVDTHGAVMVKRCMPGFGDRAAQSLVTTPHGYQEVLG